MMTSLLKYQLLKRNKFLKRWKGFHVVNEISANERSKDELLCRKDTFLAPLQVFS